MGAYAERVRASLSTGEVEPPLPLDTGWVILAPFHLERADVQRRFPSARHLLVLTAGPLRAAGGRVSYARIDPGPPPRLDPEARRRVLESCTVAVLPEGVGAASGRLLLELAELGVHRVAYREVGDWVVRSTRVAAVAKPVARLERRVARSRPGRWYRTRVARASAHRNLRTRNALTFRGEPEWRAHLERVGIRPAARSPGAPLKVALYIGQLGSGGAERQLCNLARALSARGHAVRALTTYPLTREDAHYVDLLREAGLSVGPAGAKEDPRARARLDDLSIHPEIVGSLPDVIRDPVLDLAGELLADPPHLLHCWLDYPNVIGAAAGALVGLPHVVLSTRNVSPTHFPSFYQSWMDAWYAWAAALPQTALVANSRAGAEDYARWMGVAPERIRVVPNGVDLSGMSDPEPGEIASLRRELDLRPAQPLVVGVFRLAPEKQPFLFLDVVERARRAVPDLCVAVAGVGPLRDRVEKAIGERGLSGTVRLLGARKDVRTLLAAGDALLLTSSAEGMPNVVLEAQLAGCPPVATAVGGTPEVILDRVTGRLNEPDDAAGLCASLVEILRDGERRAAIAAAGRRFVLERFSMDRICTETLRHYAALLGDREPPEPPS